MTDIEGISGVYAWEQVVPGETRYNEGRKLMPQTKAHEILKQKAKEAVENFKNVKPYTVSSPVTIKVEAVERAALPNIYAKPYIKVLDARSFELTGKSVEEAFMMAFR